MSRVQSFADFSLAIGLAADFNGDREEFAVTFRYHDDAAGSRLNYCFSRYQQDILARGGRKVDRRKHTRHQLAGRIGQLDARLERTGSRIHIRQNRADLAFEYRSLQCWRTRFDCISRADLCRQALRHVGIDPDRAETVDFEHRRPCHHGHAFTHAQFRGHTADRRENGQASLHLATRFH